ncbi:Maf family protein [Fusobacterium russii]|uniref:Maf family protein n=1 Tax=Fusobacterium russii TaxID=854 RepID=UPI0003A00146|nr:Maf family protein [Fusobacterium russii]
MILASKSIRRQEILRDSGFHLRILPADIEEKSSKDNIVDKIKDIAYKKAYYVAKSNLNDYVLAADTIVEINGEVLGKPKDREEAKRYLKLLSGNIHRVITAYSFINIEKNIYIQNADISEVKFYNLDNEEIEWYIESGEPFDKAGAYGIQGKGRLFVEQIKGDFFSIMGFPIAKFIRELKKLKIELKDIPKL